MAIIGKRNRLAVVREAPPGVYLDGVEHGEILLPGRYVPRGTRPGDRLDVFVYLDSEDRLVATIETPRVMVGGFACLKVVSVNRQIGAFLDWGLAKDLLLPFREQLGRVDVGQSVVVFVHLDPRTSRIVATMRLNPHLSRGTPPYVKDQPVRLLITARTPLGYNAVVENTYRGLLYDSNLSGPLEIGQTIRGFVHAVRTDGRIDLRLDASGYQKVFPLREQILQALQRHGNRLELDDKSPPQVIRAAFGVSKNTFKLALSALYKERRVRFQNGGTELVSS